MHTAACKKQERNDTYSLYAESMDLQSRYLENVGLAMANDYRRRPVGPTSWPIRCLSDRHKLKHRTFICLR